MAPASPQVSTPAESGGSDGNDTPFQVAFGGYVGALVASVAVVLAAMDAASWPLLAGSALAGFALGGFVGVALGRNRPELAVRLGRSRRRQLALLAPAVPLATLAGGAWLGPLESALGLAAPAATTAVLVAGYAVWVLARSRYVAAVTDDDPVGVWQWDPPGSGTVALVLLVSWIGLGVLNAAAGDWLSAIVWTGLGLCWTIATLVEGRWQLGEYGQPPEIRVHDSGLVKRRPYAQSLVPWADVDRVRLRNDELVFDRGLLDVRFDRDELEDADAVFEEIERLGSVNTFR